MPNRNKMKPHRIRWAEAERELAIREFDLPPRAVSNKLAVPPIPDTTEPRKAEPQG